ncbi:hypothetical protein CDL15_Pgr004438 [Punica granatum]|uniref:9-cis-epoxycarotenoid dioxygenase n=1 Tax=Punica granatum TaxID=22663 RepID=A0A218XGB3_PUNGR|nr:hypothetical protein CDL15_Pgr004438 [Punica granatum]
MANPPHEPVAGHHFFNRDGMIHAVRFLSSSASYAYRFTEPHRLVRERSAGRPVLPKAIDELHGYSGVARLVRKQSAGQPMFPKAIGELHGYSGVVRLLMFYAQGLFELFDPTKGLNAVNAGPVYFNKHLLSFSEDNLPYRVPDKNAKDASGIKWIIVPDCFCFHLWNAWEKPETDEVVVIGSCVTPPDSIFNESDESLKSALLEIRLNLKMGESTRRPIIPKLSK